VALAPGVSSATAPGEPRFGPGAASLPRRTLPAQGCEVGPPTGQALRGPRREVAGGHGEPPPGLGGAVTCHLAGEPARGGRRQSGLSGGGRRGRELSAPPAHPLSLGQRAGPPLVPLRGAVPCRAPGRALALRPAAPRRHDETPRGRPLPARVRGAAGRRSRAGGQRRAPRADEGAWPLRAPDGRARRLLGRGVPGHALLPRPAQGWTPPGPAPLFARPGVALVFFRPRRPGSAAPRRRRAVRAAGRPAVAGATAPARLAAGSRPPPPRRPPVAPPIAAARPPGAARCARAAPLPRHIGGGGGGSARLVTGPYFLPRAGLRRRGGVWGRARLSGRRACRV
jgi:hypothetical protein